MFTRRQRGRFILLLAMWFVWYLGTYTWLGMAPTFFVDKGYTLTGSIGFMLAASIGYSVGSNVLLGEAKKRLSLVRQSIWYTKAKKSTDKKERQDLFAAARQAHGFSAYALQAVADEMRRSTWLGNHLDSHVA